jgi:hypothetical protein
MYTLLFLVVFISYYFLLKNINNNRKYFYLLVFILFSIIIKLIIPLSELRDYFTYAKVLSDKGYKKILFADILFEPYFLFLSKILLSWFSISQVLKFYYFFLFMLSTSFFIWIAFIEEVSFWKKYFLFNIFFILFSFILLRNGIAYMMLALFFYYLSKDRFLLSFFSALFFHITTVPVLFLSLLREKKLNFYIIPLGVLIVFSFIYLFLNESSLFFLKYKDFKKNSSFYNYTAHYTVFFLSLSYFTFCLFFFKKTLFNYFYFLLIFIYAVLFYFNPVMGFRFSFYILLYLMLNTKLLFSSRLENILNSYSILFIVFGFLTFKLFLYI